MKGSLQTPKPHATKVFPVLDLYAREAHDVLADVFFHEYNEKIRIETEMVKKLVRKLARRIEEGKPILGFIADEMLYMYGVDVVGLALKLITEGEDVFRDFVVTPRIYVP